ncbi:hypothetical protein BBP40_005068 [Aspergillus hancockii]|nr:hypothetical protein BBP40_005068 [Aspergillus hancockii]
MAIMVICRMLLRHQDSPLFQKKIYGNHEMDWLALARVLDQECLCGSGSRLAMEWRLCTGEAAPGEIAPVSSDQSSVTSTSVPKSQAETILNIRQQLHTVCKWSGPAQEEATLLHEAIKKAWMVFKGRLTNDQVQGFHWVLNVKAGTVENSPAPTSVKLQITEDQPCLPQIEAALSLASFEPEQKRGEQASLCVGPKDSIDLAALEKVARNGVRKERTHILLLGLQEDELLLKKPSSLKHSDKVFIVWNVDGQTNCSRIVGFKAKVGFSTDKPYETRHIDWGSQIHGKHQLAIAVDKLGSPVLHALHIFASFMWAVARAVEKGPSDKSDYTFDLENLAGKLNAINLAHPEHLYWLTFAPFISLGLVNNLTPTCRFPTKQIGYRKSCI